VETAKRYELDNIYSYWPLNLISERMRMRNLSHPHSF
jgi:hypothetical protein